MTLTTVTNGQTSDASQLNQIINVLSDNYGSKSSIVVAPTGVNLQSKGADMSGGTVSDAAWTAALAALPSGGGEIYLPPGTPTLGTTQILSDNLTVKGAGMGATTLQATSGLGAPMFQRIVSGNGGAMSGMAIRDLTLDGNTGPTGTIKAISLDSTAFNNIAYTKILFERVLFKNFNVGGYHIANNAGTGAMTQGIAWSHCRFENCGWGIHLGGTYGEWIDHCYFSLCTKWGIGSAGIAFNDKGGGTGPTTDVNLSHVNVEGLGLFTSGNDSGIGLNASGSRLSDILVSNVSLGGLYLANPEPDIQTIVNNLQMYGTGGGIELWGTNAQAGGSLQNVSLIGVGRNNSFWPGGFNQRQYPFAVESGNWKINGGNCRLIGGFNTPAYGIQVGVGLNQVGRLQFTDVDFPTYGTALYNIVDTNAPFFLRTCPGYNPVGTETVAVPASTVAVAATNHDRTYYVQAGASTVTMAIQNGPAPVIPANGFAPIRVPAGKTVTPTYANAPTWLVEGE